MTDTNLEAVAIAAVLAPTDETIDEALARVAAERREIDALPTTILGIAGAWERSQPCEDNALCALSFWSSHGSPISLSAHQYLATPEKPLRWIVAASKGSYFAGSGLTLDEAREDLVRNLRIAVEIAGEIA